MQKINKVLLATFVPNTLNYLKKEFPHIEFYSIPVKRSSKGPQALINDEIIKDIKAYEYLISDAAVGGQLVSLMPDLKWIQATSAGVDGFFSHADQHQLNKKLILTRMTGVFGPLMSEYIASQIINWERYYYPMHDNQKEHKWDYIKWGYKTFEDLTIGIMGLGDIGTEIARVCKAFGSRVISLTRSPKSGLDYVDESMVDTQLKEFLGKIDYVVSVLPSLPSTRGMLNNDILQHASNKKPVLINIGRGDLISEQQIIKALSEKWISGAVLDVFETEPLPADSKLWDMPNVVITPHVSGTTQDKLIAKVFKKNFERFEKGEKLLGVVDFEKQY